MNDYFRFKCVRNRNKAEEKKLRSESIPERIAMHLENVRIDAEFLDPRCIDLFPSP